MMREHKDFITSPSAKSCTRYIKGVRIPEEVMNSRQPELYITDTAGFEDSAGSEVDASNSLATLKILQKANSIRPVFVINEKGWGNRG